MKRARINILNHEILGNDDNVGQWRSEGIWRPGANLNFAPPPPQKNF